MVSMPISGYLAEFGFDGGWPSIFYCFGILGALWSVLFLFIVDEDPETCKKIKEDERKYIISSVWGAAGISVSLLFLNSYIIHVQVSLVLNLMCVKNCLVTILVFYGFNGLMIKLNTYQTIGQYKTDIIL